MLNEFMSKESQLVLFNKAQEFLVDLTISNLDHELELFIQIEYIL